MDSTITIKAIVAANIVLCTCSIAAYLNEFLHCMYYAQMYAELLRYKFSKDL